MCMLTILVLAFIQNISFSIVSRSRNRNNIKYHLIAAAFSNTIWFLTFRQLVKADMNFILFLPYAAGTMMGSVCGVKISMFIEKLLGASAEAHLGKKSNDPTTKDLVAYWAYVEDPKRPMHEACQNFMDWFKQEGQKK